MSRLGRQNKLQNITLGFILTAAAGCAGQIPEPQHGRAAGEWQVHLPTSESAVHGLAFGRGGSSTPAEPVVLASLDDVLRSEPQVASERAVKRNVVRHKASAAPSSAPVAPAPQNTPAKPIAAPVAQPPMQLAMADTTTTTQSAEDRYAERETQAQKQEQFRGGDAIVIGAGTLVVILLIVLLVLLLT